MIDVPYIVLVVFLLLLILGVQVYVSFGLSISIAVLFGEFQLRILASRMLSSVDTYTLLVIPLFIYVGILMNESDLSDRLFDLVNSIVGRVTGGLVYVNILSSLVFSGFSGSAVADVGSIGKVIMNQMESEGYRSDFSAAVTSAASTVGPIFPPSVPIIVYGLLAETSITQLLLAGVLPGIFVSTLLIISTPIFSNYIDFPAPQEEAVSTREILEKSVSSAPIIFVPVVLIGGLLLGFFGPVEIAAVTVVYIILINGVFYDSNDWRYIWVASKKTVELSSVILIIVAIAEVLSFYIAYHGIDRDVADTLLSTTNSPLIMIFLIIFMLLIAGMFLEPIAALVISVPLFVPPLTSLGFDPVHIGIVMVVTLMIGLITPPFGLTVYLSSKIVDEDPSRVFITSTPYVFILLFAVIILIIFPGMSLWILKFI